MPGLYPNSYSIAAIERFTIGLADAARGASLDTPIPTCDPWLLRDLVWHLTEVQDFWTFIITNRPANYDRYQRPSQGSDARLVADLRAGVERLVAALEPCALDEPAWTWADEQTVGFTVRRQTHEALTHSIDGLLALGHALPDVSPQLAADGVDEIVTVMLGEGPATSVRLHATDTDDRWSCGQGAATPPTAIIEGTALDLNLWLWGRTGIDSLTLSGDPAAAEAVRTQLVSNTQ